MSWMEFWTSGLFLGMSVVIALVLFFLMRGPAGRLLGLNSRLTEARAFFVRLLLVMLLLSGCGAAGGRMFGVSTGSAFMECVWKVAGSLNEVLWVFVLVLAGYALVMLILLLGLGRYRD